jgi:hypothetical protein
VEWVNWSSRREGFRLGGIVPSMEQLLADEQGSQSKKKGLLTALSFRIRLTTLTILKMILRIEESSTTDVFSSRDAHLV